jgi:hypothetical protein
MNMLHHFDNIAMHHELWKSVVLNLVMALIGIIPKSLRGVALNFDGKTIQVAMFFETSPTDREVEDMLNVEAELISHHDFQSDLVLSVVPTSESLLEKNGNWGWVYLRRED